MPDTSLTVNAADFDELQASFKTWMKSKAKFADYDFDGSNISALISLLSYNTYLNLFYHNMGINETFLDSAMFRNSAVSRAKELNYVPRSFTSAQATVDVEVSSTNLSRSSIVIPKGTMFTTRIADRSYTFTTDRSYVTTESTVSGGSITFIARDVELFEGHYLTETVPFTAGKFITIPNQQVDTSSITVNVLEDNGGTTLAYQRALNLFDLDDTSKVFFLQGSTDGKYEIGFGESVFGRSPKDNSLITIDYRISNGELPNGAQEFRAAQSIDGETAITVTTSTAAHSGSVYESLASIKLNAPRHFASQGNAVTADDYGALLQETFPEIIDVASYGGEDATPPQYGRVMIGVVLNGIDFVPESKKKIYYDFLRARSLMKPVFIEPTFIYGEITSTVNYDITKTAINTDDVKTIVLDAVISYSNAHLNRFASTLRSSRLTSAIDGSHASITSNDTSLRLIYELGSRDWQQGTFTVPFGVAVTSITSQVFKYQQNNVIITETDGDLTLVNTSTKQTVRSIGTVDKATGDVVLSGFSPDDATTPIKLYATPVSKDVGAGPNTIIKIREQDVKLTIVKSR